MSLFAQRTAKFNRTGEPAGPSIDPSPIPKPTTGPSPEPNVPVEPDPEPQLPPGPLPTPTPVT